jgi:hypothetical protein
MAAALERFEILFRRVNVASPVRHRLRADLDDFEAEYGERIGAGKSTAPPAAWAVATERHLHNARQALAQLDIDAGHQSLQSAARDALASLTPAERRSRLISLQQEVVDKLGGSWRGKAARELLKGEPDAISIEAMREALLHLHMHAQNSYRKLALLRRQVSLIGLILIVLVTAAVVAALSGLVDELNAPLFASSVFAGLLGGTLSAALSSVRVSSRARVPDAQRSGMIVLARTFIGAAAAIPTFAMIETGILGIEANDTLALPFFCFLSGFSERWFLERLSDATGKDATDAAKLSVTNP